MKILLTAFLIATAAYAAEPWTTSGLVGTGSPGLPYKVESLATGIKFDGVLVALDPVPGAPYLVITNLNGQLSIIDDVPQPSHTHDFLNLGHGYAYSIAFHPQYPDTPYIYVCWNEIDEGANRKSPLDAATNTVARFTVDTETAPPTADIHSRLDIITWPTNGHNGGDLHFGPTDGMLYIPTGDGQTYSDPTNTGQDTDNLRASILRIDVSTTPYTVPPDNPFVATPGTRPEIWAYGFRNPWKIAFEPNTNAIWVGDNGDWLWETIRRATKATNHGWSAYEGSHVFRKTNTLKGPVKTLTTPAYEHPHSEIRSVIGGGFYKRFPGQYLYGCYMTGKIWALDWDGTTATNARRIADAGSAIYAFGETGSGDPLILTQREILRLVPAKEIAPPKPPPPTYSTTGLADAAPYTVAISAWADGLEATYQLGLPEGKINAAASAHQERSWIVPNGTAAAQTYSLDGKKIETRVIHFDKNEWHFLTYQWNDDATDASLVPPEGASITLPNGNPWHFPGRAECTVCHNDNSNFFLSLTTAQLDHHGQIEAFQKAGRFRGNNPGRSYAPLDPENPRHYLHVNCAHCHREGGAGGRAEFQLLHKLTLEETGLITDTPPLVSISGHPDARVLTPGNPARSELLDRMNRRDGAKMPLIGSDVIDTQGVALIKKWIASQ